MFSGMYIPEFSIHSLAIFSKAQFFDTHFWLFWNTLKIESQRIISSVDFNLRKCFSFSFLQKFLWFFQKRQIEIWQLLEYYFLKPNISKILLGNSQHAMFFDSAHRIEICIPEFWYRFLGNFEKRPIFQFKIFDCFLDNLWKLNRNTRI